MDEERPPFSDSIESIAAPNRSDLLLGHDAALARLMNAWQSGQMHHAWLLSGPLGIGKSTLAFHLARHVLHDPERKIATTRPDPAAWSESLRGQVAIGAHPGLLHLTKPWDSEKKRFKTRLTVDEVRRIQSFYQMTSATSGWRITIIDAADDMNPNAANALLKMLEEPPKKALFLVIAHGSRSLLPTIRSRCQLITMPGLGDDEVADIVRHQMPDVHKDALSKAVHLAKGSARQAFRILQGGVFEPFEAYRISVLEEPKSEADAWAQAHRTADLLMRKGAEDAYSLFIDLLLDWIGDRARRGEDRDLARLAAWAQVWDKANELVTTTDAFNLNRKQLILSLTDAVIGMKQGAQGHR